METGKNGGLQFLDVLVTRSEDRLVHTIYATKLQIRMDRYLNQTTIRGKNGA